MLDEVLGVATSRSSGAKGESADPAVDGPVEGAGGVGEPGLDWSVDDPVDDPGAPDPPGAPTTNGGSAATAAAPGEPDQASHGQPTTQQPSVDPPPPVLDAHDIDVPDHDEQIMPTGDTGFVLPQIVQATSDAPEPGDAGPATQPVVLERTATPMPPTPVVPPPGAPPASPPTGVAAGPSARPAGAAVPPTTPWHEHVPAMAAGGAMRAPTRRPRVRRVTRVIRHIDPWSTFKLAVLFSLVAYVATLTSGVLLWRVAETTGALDNVERWFTQFGWETFEFKGGEIFHNAWIIGLFGAVFATGGAVLLVTLFNLVSDIIGGIRVTVLEEEVVERTVSSTRRYVVRRPSAVDPVSASEPWSLDDGSPAAESAESTGPVAESTGSTPEAAGPASTDSWSVDDPPTAG